MEAKAPTVVLIDEIDKADIEFPDDLLRELDRMAFHVYETRQTVRVATGPSSSSPNKEEELPDAFLRRGFFHYISFIPAEALRSPDQEAAMPPPAGALLKNEQDIHVFERLVFMARHHR